MPIYVKFENTDYLVVWTFEGKWAWEDYYSQRDAVNAKIESSLHRVDMIVDMTNGSMLPQNVLSHAGSAVRKAPNNIGTIIIVGPSAFLRTFFSFFKRMYGMLNPQQEQHLHMVATLGEAHEILNKKELK